MTAEHTTPADREKVSDAQRDHTGAERAEFGRTIAGADVLPRVHESDPVDLYVDGEYLDDEPSWVHMRAKVGGADVKFCLQPGEAKALASKLRAAAAFVDREDAQE